MTPSHDVQSLLDRMTIEEKCRMLHGVNTWDVHGCERLGVPEWNVSDGPVGVRGRLGVASLLVPGPSALAASWDPSLVEQVGAALGAECLDRNVDMLLAPTTNLHRSPRAGRHFESYSEEPALSTEMAVAYIRGVQSTGVGACIKHYVANDQEHERTTIDVDVDERTLREIYLPPFEAAVAEADVRGVMAAYNFVNGEHACAHRELLEDVLKDEWDFDGLVISDWYAVKDTLGPALGGLDLEMPGPGRFWGKGQLHDAVRAGDVDVALIDDKVARILGFLEWRGRLAGRTNHEEIQQERPEHRVLAHRAAVESTVLIKNDGALPLNPDAKVAVIGSLAERTAAQGGGSARLPPYRKPSLLASLIAQLGDRLVGFSPGVDLRRLPSAPKPEWLRGSDPIRVELFAGASHEGEPLESDTTHDALTMWQRHPALEVDATHSTRLATTVQVPSGGDYVIVGMATGAVTIALDGEIVATTTADDLEIEFALSTARATVGLEAGREYEIRIESSFTEINDLATGAVGIRLGAVGRSANELAADAAAVAAQAERAIVVVGTTSHWETEGEDRQSLDLPAEQSLLVERVAAANPNTIVVLNCGSPVNMPWFDDVSAVVLGWYPGQEGGDALAEVLTGRADPGGRMPTTWAVDEADTPSFAHYPGVDGVVRYAEGVFVGYRHYDRKSIAPRVPFGHGNSYATFEWGEPSVRAVGESWRVEVPITNRSERNGTEVVQVYVGPAIRVEDRPDKVLGGFAKVVVPAGATAVACVHIRPRAFEMWDVSAHGWCRPPGEYLITVGASAVDARFATTITLSS